mmetsp:Transcript_1137/g.2019  ORF Transcript_1137/g.2019 Transcript_1137/m.2019 type:complete len:238 (-) Transcript_1137:1288-2001(-)
MVDRDRSDNLAPRLRRYGDAGSLTSGGSSARSCSSKAGSSICSSSSLSLKAWAAKAEEMASISNEGGGVLGRVSDRGGGVGSVAKTFAFASGSSGTSCLDPTTTHEWSPLPDVSTAGDATVAPIVAAIVAIAVGAGGRLGLASHCKGLIMYCCTARVCTQKSCKGAPCASPAACEPAACDSQYAVTLRMGMVTVNSEMEEKHGAREDDDVLDPFSTLSTYTEFRLVLARISTDRLAL